MIVYKFGGTVLQNEEKVVEIIKSGLIEKEKIIVVVSALGRLHSPYSTDTFYGMSTYVNEKEMARMVSCGEIISSVKLSNLLRRNNINATSVSIYEIDLRYNECFEMNDYILNLLDVYDVIIVPGFIGLRENEIVLLPRGGSNVTASFLASYFKTELIIFTDIDGIYLNDPKENLDAKKIKKMTYDELKEITKENQKLFPLEGIKYLESSNVKVLIRNLDTNDGTIINRI